MVELKKRLVDEKGWPEEIARKTDEILSSKHMQEKHVEFGKTMTGLMFWIALLVLTLCMIGFALFLIPFLIMTSSYFLQFVVMALGVVFGLIFVFIINDIEHLERKHHIIAGFYIPIMAIAFLTISVAISNRVDEILGIKLVNSPWIVSLVFVITFMVPYFIDLFIKRKKSL
jgi:UDP-N-acetylmuramyl pentapeptide phosphotransferase/UDP-N-acetylglucosamine-1-phosphate transferase